MRRHIALVSAAGYGSAVDSLPHRAAGFSDMRTVGKPAFTLIRRKFRKTPRQSLQIFGSEIFGQKAAEARRVYNPAASQLKKLGMARSVPSAPELAAYVSRERDVGLTQQIDQR